MGRGGKGKTGPGVPQTSTSGMPDVAQLLATIQTMQTTILSLQSQLQNQARAPSKEDVNRGTAACETKVQNQSQSGRQNLRSQAQPPNLEDGPWSTVKKQKKQKKPEEPAAEPATKAAVAAEERLVEGWDFPILETLVKDQDGLCLATSKQHAVEMINDFQFSTNKMAVLSPCPIEGNGTPCNILVKTVDGKETHRRRYMLLVGKSEVSPQFVKSGAFALGPPASVGTKVLLIRLCQSHCDPQAWKFANVKPHIAFREWLQETVKIRPWIFSGPRPGR